MLLVCLLVWMAVAGWVAAAELAPRLTLRVHQIRTVLAMRQRHVLLQNQSQAQVPTLVAMTVVLMAEPVPRQMTQW